MLEFWDCSKLFLTPRAGRVEVWYQSSVDKNLAFYSTRPCGTRLRERGLRGVVEGWGLVREEEVWDFDSLLLGSLMWMRLVRARKKADVLDWVAADSVAARLALAGDEWRFPLYTRGSLVGVAMKGLALKPADFAKAIMFWTSHLSVVDGKSPWLDCLLCTLKSWLSGQRGRGCVGGGRRKEDRNKFPSWISSVDQKGWILLKRFSKNMLHFQVFAEGRNNYIRSGFLRVYNSFIHCAKYLLIFWGFGGISPLGEYGGICFSF